MNDGDSSLTPIDLGASYRVLCEACGVLGFSDRTRLILSGDDRQSFLHNLCTNDIKKLSRGQGCEAFITNVQGKCLGFVTVLNADDEVIVETVPQQADLLLSHFDRYLITEDVELEDVGSRTCELMVVGPRAVEQLEAVAEGALPSLAYDHIRTSMQGIDCRVSVIPWLRVPARMIIADVAASSQLVSALTGAGCLPCDVESFHRLRIESRFPWFGWDVTENNLPQEVDRNASAISFTKGCYLGQETVARLDALGHVNRSLVVVRGPDSIPLTPGSDVQVDGSQVGVITSAAALPNGDPALALAYLRCQFTDPGTVVQLSTGAGEVITPVT